LRTLGVALVALACLIALAGLADVLGPYLDAWGVPLRGSLYPWQVWLLAGLIALAAGATLWRMGDARVRRATAASIESDGHDTRRGSGLDS
jgi:hypothetical protein